MAGIPAGRLSIELVAEVHRLQKDLDKAKRYMKAASTDIARSAKAANDNIRGMGGSSRLASHHMQNLSFQIQDIIIGLKGGQKPMTVFMQQGSQIAQIMTQAQVGVLGLTKAVAAQGAAMVAAHPVLLAIAAGAAALSVAVGSVTAEINKNSEVQVTWSDTLLGIYDTIKEALETQVSAAFEAMGLDVADVWDFIVKATKIAINAVIAVIVAVPKLIADTYDKIPAAFGDAFYSAVNLAIRALNMLVKASTVPLNSITQAFNEVFGTDIPKVVLDGVDEIANPYAGAMSALGSAGAASLVGTFRKDYVGGIADAVSVNAQRRAMARLAKEAEEDGKKGGAKAGKATGKAMADEMEKELLKFLDTFGKTLFQVDKQLNQAFDDRVVKDFNDAMERARGQQRERTQGAVDEADAWQRFNDELALTVNLFREIGGVGEGIGNALGLIYGLTSGDFSLLGGRIGASFALFQQTDEGKKFIAELGAELKGLFGENGDFVKGLTEALQFAGFGAGIGGGVAQIVGGSSVGGQIGGALGGALGSQFLAGGAGAIANLGAFAGPVGAIAGALLGSIVPKLLAGHEKGGATFNSSGGFAITGDDSKFEQAAGELARAALDTAQQIADVLGATNVTLRGTLGVRDGNIRYAANGTSANSLKGAPNFGQDAEGAIRAAIANATFEGLSEGAQNYIKSGDLESRINDLLLVRAAQDELKSLRDPQGFALEQLDATFEELRRIATATGESLADIEELYSLKRQDILKQYGDDTAEIEQSLAEKRIELLLAQGLGTKAIIAARQLELETMSEAEQAIQRAIYYEQDRAARRQISIQILELEGRAEEALRMRREDEIKASEASLVPLLLRKYALEDEAKAAEEAARAAEELAQAQRAIADEITGLERRWLEVIGDTAALRQLDLDALQSDEAREIQQRIWDYQDALAAQAAAQALAEEQARLASEAQASYNQALASARDALSQAYQRERSELEATRDTFRGFASTIRDFRLSLLAANDNGFMSYARSRDIFTSVAGQAGRGNADAVGRFSSSANTFLDRSLATSRTRIDYQNDVAFVAGKALEAEARLGGRASSAERQIMALEQQVEGLIEINESVLSVEDAIFDLRRIEEQGPPIIADTIAVGLSEVGASIEQAAAKSESSEADTRTALEAVAKSVAALERKVAQIRIQGGAVTVRTDSDTPIDTAEAA